MGDQGAELLKAVEQRKEARRVRPIVRSNCSQSHCESRGRLNQRIRKRRSASDPRRVIEIGVAVRVVRPRQYSQCALFRGSARIQRGDSVLGQGSSLMSCSPDRTKGQFGFQLQQKATVHYRSPFVSANPLPKVHASSRALPVWLVFLLFDCREVHQSASGFPGDTRPCNWMSEYCDRGRLQS